MILNSPAPRETKAISRIILLDFLNNKDKIKMEAKSDELKSLIFLRILKLILPILPLKSCQIIGNV